MITSGTNRRDTGKRWAGLLWPSLAALVGLAVLVGLGTWQLERKAWKEALIAKIEARSRAAPAAIETLAPALQSGADLEYTRARATGRWHHDKARFLFAPEGGSTGWHLYMPLELATGDILWINRGWVSQSARDTQPWAQRDAPIEVIGLVRHPGQPNRFTPVNDAARNIWYWRDLSGLSKSAFSSPNQTFIPLSLDAEAGPGAPAVGEPRGGVTRIALPNRHLEYALTWYGLALALIGVYSVFAWQRFPTARRPAAAPTEVDAKNRDFR